MKPEVKFNYGDNIYILLGRMRKVLPEEVFKQFDSKIPYMEHDDVVEEAENLVEIVED